MSRNRWTIICIYYINVNFQLTVSNSEHPYIVSSVHLILHLYICNSNEDEDVFFLKNTITGGRRVREPTQTNCRVTNTNRFLKNSNGHYWDEHIIVKRIKKRFGTLISGVLPQVQQERIQDYPIEWLTKTSGSPTQEDLVRALVNAVSVLLTTVWLESTIWTSVVNASEKRLATSASTSTGKFLYIVTVYLRL